MEGKGKIGKIGKGPIKWENGMNEIKACISMPQWAGTSIVRNNKLDQLA